MKTPAVGLMLYAHDNQPRDAAREDRYRLLVEKIIARSWSVRTLNYHDSRRDALRAEARLCDAVLVWINPTEPQLDRDALDGLLRELAGSGVLVSAHPDAIGRIGTKEVLVATQSLTWSVDTVAHRSVAEFRSAFPAALRRDGARVLKQTRGHSGIGVWKVTATAAGGYILQSAVRGETPRVLAEEELIALFATEVFSRGGHLIDQRWVDSMQRGMLRAYLSGTKVAGFGYQEIVALHPANPDDDFTRLGPSRRHYYSPSCHLFQNLRPRLEREWIPALQTLTAMSPDDFPLLWDADFFFGEPPDAEFVLCEINTSCVSPFPDSAITPLLDGLARRLSSRR